MFNWLANLDVKFWVNLEKLYRNFFKPNFFQVVLKPEFTKKKKKSDNTGGKPLDRCILASFLSAVQVDAGTRSLKIIFPLWSVTDQNH